MSLSSNFPTSKPSLNLDFANVGALDPRITFTRSSSATYTNSLGLITTAATNVARFDYDPVTLAARGLLVEESRTNLVTYSEQFDNAAWAGATTAGSVSANATTSPDGTVNADLFIPDTSSSATHRAIQFTSTSSGTFSVSVYAKAAGYSRFFVFAGGANQSALFDLTTQTVVADTRFAAAPSNMTITAIGNGWYRCLFSTNISAAVTNVQITVLNSTANPGDSWTGNGTSGLYIWGAQLEAGSFATSYIPTLASTVTRSADVASVNTLSPWHNSVEGTLYAEGNFIAPTSSSSKGIATLVDNSAGNDSISIFGISSSNVKQEVLVGGASQASFTLGYSSNIKAATAYKANDTNAAVNGTTGTTDTSCTVPTVAKLQLGGIYNGTSFQLNGWLRRVAFYPRRLLDAELQALTS